jgi:hypothetical protein
VKKLTKTITFHDTIPTIITLCGSTKFRDEFHAANARLTRDGRIVLSVGFFMHSEETPISDEQKKALDQLHFRKIDASDGIYVVNVGGYVGQSTAREIAYAVATHKDIAWLDYAAGDKFMSDNSHRLGAMVAAFIEGRVPELS